jgi:glycosyltransferase involved in cell wall biosynthesis
MGEFSATSYPRFVIVSPVRDEELHIKLTIQSVIKQTVRPVLWVIVNDGSSDGTKEILDRCSARFSWIKVFHRKNRGYRKAGGGVVEAFYDGYFALGDNRWDFIVKLDGDLSFSSDYFQKCFSYFSGDQKLGIGGGTVFTQQKGRFDVDSAGDPPFHVRGATKIYRRSCWEKISPLVRAPGWDTIDEVKANFYGWSTRTFPDIMLIQHKSTGSADGNWHNWFKNGLANYITGYHPVFMLAKCVNRTFEKPPLIASLALFSGFCYGYLKKIPQVQEYEIIRYLRKQQLRRLLLRTSIYS